MLKKSLQAIAYSNLWISIGATCFTLLFYLSKGWDVSYPLLAFIFFSTLLTYTFQRYTKLRANERTSGPRMEWMKKYPKTVLTILFISSIGTSALVFTLNPVSILTLILLGAISLLYAYKVKVGSEKKSNLRDIPGLKIFLIGLVWAGTCVVLPYLESEFKDSSIITSYFGFALFILGITIPFDIRDLEVDEKNKHTIPQIFGVLGSKIIAVLLIAASTYLIHLGSEVSVFALLPGVILSLLLIFASNKARHELYYSIGVDGLLILVPLSTYLLNSL